MLSVVVCTFNREDLIEKSLTHLAEQSDKEFEVIIVDNNSTDKTNDICQRFIEQHKELNFYIVLEQEVGLCAARNRGLKEAKGDYVIYMDDDAFAHADYIANLKKFIHLNPHVRVCGGKILPYFESKRPKWLSKYILPMVTTLDKGKKITFFKNRSFPIGANMIIHKEKFAKYGIFNEKLGFKGANRSVSSDEKEFFLRFIDKEIKAYYLPDVCVEHWIPDSRLTEDYFNKQSKSFGTSERVRAKNISSFEFIKSCIREIMKWGATIMLWFCYTLSFKYQAANKLIAFRINVSKGLLGY